MDGTRSRQTSTTNIGAYLCSTVAAERLGIISHAEAVARTWRTISTLERMERYAPSGQFFNCYDTVVSESRIAGYIGIAKGELPPKECYGAWRSFPDTCDWSWQETRPDCTKRGTATRTPTDRTTCRSTRA